MSLFSFLKHESPILLLLSDNVLQALQFSHDGALKITGANEAPLEKGVVADGHVVNMEVFQEALKTLFSLAKPQSIQGERLIMNIPCKQLYSFVEDFPLDTREDLLKESMKTKIRNHSPIPFEELALDYVSAMAVAGKKQSYAVYGTPIKWKSRLLKAVQPFGIEAIQLIPEPICLRALFPEAQTKDFALIANDSGYLTISIFRNGLAYDSYLLSQINQDEPLDCSVCLNDLKRSQNDFENHFGVPLAAYNFVGFNKAQRKTIESYLAKQKIALNFFGPEDLARFEKWLPNSFGKPALWGLLQYLVPELSAKSVVSGKKAINLKHKTF